MNRAKNEKVVPVPVNVVKVGENEFQLNWQNPNSNDLLAIRISRRVGEGEWDDNCKEIPADVTSCFDSLNVTSEVVLSYRLQAILIDDSSDFSEPMAYFDPATVPTNVAVRQIDTQKFRLSWSDNSVGEEQFIVDKKIGNRNWQNNYHQVSANQTEYIDSNISGSDTVYYRISANAGISNSQTSSIVKEKPGTLSLTNLYFGTESSFEILTWNIQNFPRKNGDTIISLAQAIKALQVDIIAFQEVESSSSFSALIDSIDNYQGFRANSAYADLDIAYLYNTTTVIIDSIYEIYSRESSAFPRRPLVMRCHWREVPLVVINNHFKAYEDSESRARRLEASELLVEYIQNYFDDENVIIVGDFNDEVTDNQNYNVFQPFIELSSSFQFADMSIANGSSSQWSYPTWPSHIDHIIISDELFDEFADSNTDIRTLLIEKYFSSGWNEYALKISDHRPLGMKFSNVNNN